MNVRTRRAVARAGVGVLALAATGALAAVAGPAYAAENDADLELTVATDKVLVDGSFRELSTTVVNKGPAVSPRWTLEYDLSGLDTDVVEIVDVEVLGCAKTGDKVACQQPGLSVGHSMLVPEVPFALEPVAGKKGAAGTIGVTAVTENDPNLENNTTKVAVEVPAKGVDLAVYAEDVYQITEEGELTDDPVPPGGTSFVLGAVGNLGDTIAKGVKVSVSLPEHVTFAEEQAGCAYSAGNRTVTCTYPDITLIPLDEDTNEEDDVHSVIGVYFPVAVAEDAPGPVVLDGGTLSAFALGVEDEVNPSVLARSESAALPAGVKALSGKDIKDANPDDNTDEFSVHVGGPASGGGGGGGGLPVTGVQVGVIATGGAAVLAAGAVLFFLARRRRVVLVTPGDEKPTA